MRVGFWRAVGSDKRWIERQSLAGLCLEAHAHHVIGDSVQFEFLRTAANATEAVEQGRVDVLAVSSVTDVWAEALRVIEHAAESCPVVVGGPHATLVPGAEPFPLGRVTYVMGEGEAAFVQVLQTLEAGRTPLPIVVGEQLDLGQAMWLPLATLDPSGYMAASVSRGCGYHCTFCSARRMWEGTRNFPPWYVEEWFRKRRQTFDSVGFYDLTFLADMGWAEATVTRLKRIGAGSAFDVTMVSARTDILTDAACELLKSIGVRVVGVGLESVSQRILAKLKPHVTVQDHERAVRLCYKHGLTLHGSFIFGTPGETDADLQATFDFISRWQGKGFQVSGLYILTPYPGTDWWHRARRMGLIQHPVDWSRWHLAARSPDDWERVIYLNEEAMPRQRAREWRLRVGELARQRDPSHVPIEVLA